MDPWGKERFERLARENARLNNFFLDYLEKTDTLRESLAVILLPAAIGTFLK